MILFFKVVHLVFHSIKMFSLFLSKHFKHSVPPFTFKFSIVDMNFEEIINVNRNKFRIFHFTMSLLFAM